MTDLQLRLEVQAAAQNWVASIMQQYGVSATMMEDALTKVLLNLKDLVAQEAIQSMLAEQAPIQEEKEINDDEQTDI